MNVQLQPASISPVAAAYLCASGVDKADIKLLRDIEV